MLHYPFLGSWFVLLPSLHRPFAVHSMSRTLYMYSFVRVVLFVIVVPWHPPSFAHVASRLYTLFSQSLAITCTPCALTHFILPGALVVLAYT